MDAVQLVTDKTDWFNNPIQFLIQSASKKTHHSRKVVLLIDKYFQYYVAKSLTENQLYWCESYKDQLESVKPTKQPTNQEKKELI